MSSYLQLDLSLISEGGITGNDAGVNGGVSQSFPIAVNRVLAVIARRNGIVNRGQVWEIGIGYNTNHIEIDSTDGYYSDSYTWIAICLISY